jgi:hypothetical protein
MNRPILTALATLSPKYYWEVRTTPTTSGPHEYSAPEIILKDVPADVIADRIETLVPPLPPIMF